MGTGSLVCVISLIDLHNPQKQRAGRGSEGQEREGEVKSEETREKDKERAGKANHRREKKKGTEFWDVLYYLCPSN